MRLRSPSWLPPTATLGAVAAVAVLVGSLLPAPTAAADGVSLAAPLGIGLDKWVHAASYAVVAGLAAAGYVGGRDWRAGSGPPRPRAVAPVLTLVALVALVGAFGAAVEAAQSLVPGRTASGADALANTVGAVVGVVGWWAVRRLRPAAVRG